MKEMMRKGKRFVCLTLAIIMLASTWGMVGLAKEKTLADYDDVYYALDASKKSSITAVGLEADSDNTNENTYSAKWELKNKDILKLPAKDIAGYDTIEFYMYGDKDYPTTLLFTIWADDTSEAGSDYYTGGNFEVKPGWNKYTFKLSELINKKARNPKPLTDVDGVWIYATGWGLEKKNDFENTVLYLDSVKFLKGDKILKQEAAVSEKEEELASVDPVIYFEYDFNVDKKERISAISWSPKANTMTIRENEGNKYVAIEAKNNGNDMFFQQSVKGTKSKIVIQGDYMVENVDAVLVPIVARDAKGGQCNVVTINSAGEIKGGGESFGEMKKGKWVNIAACIDTDTDTYDVYIDGKLKKSGVKLATSIENVALLRVYVSPGSSIFNVDNLRMFDGENLKDYEKAEKLPEPKPVVKEIDVNTEEIPAYIQAKRDAVEEVKDAVCLKINSPFALVRHEQKPIDENNCEVAPFIINGRTLVPVRFIAEAFGAEVGWDDLTRTVTVKKDNDLLSLAIGSNVINKNGENIAIDVPAEIYNERTMLPLRAVTENLGKKVFWDDMGLIIISDNEINFTKENDLDKMLDVIAGIIYERPSRQKIAEDVLKNSPGHPRLMATKADFDRIRHLYQTDENMRLIADAVIAEADEYVKSAPNEKEHTYASDSGGRLLEDWFIEEKANCMGMAYQITGDKKYPEAMWYTLKDMCNRELWEHWHPGHFLNASSCMHGVAMAYDWMYDAWTPEQKTIMEEALYDCGIEDFITSFHGADDYLAPPMDVWNRSGWWKNTSNWNPVCNSGGMAAGMVLIGHEKYGDLAAKAVCYGLNAIEAGFRPYAPEGDFEEGPGYWQFASEHIIKAIETMYKGTGKTYGLELSPGFEDTYSNPIYFESVVGSFNLGDRGDSGMNSNLLFWFADKYDIPELAGLRFNQLKTGIKDFSYRDVLWFDADSVKTNATLKLDHAFKNDATATFRSSLTDKNQLFVGMHGGDNSANHGNLDAGAFVLDALNTRWFMDFGTENYNLPNYFYLKEGSDKWKYYTQRAEGHNTIVINPDDKEDQKVNSYSPIVKFESKQRGSFGVFDLTPAYQKNAEAAKRGVMMAANRKAVVIQDEIIMKAPSEFYWFAHTKADIEIAPDGRSAILTKDGRKLHVQIVCDNADFKFEVMEPETLPTTPKVNLGGQTEYPRLGVKKLAIHGIGIETVDLAVVCQPMVEDTPGYAYTYEKMDKWAIPDGGIVNPTLTNLTVGGEAISGFAPELTDYSILLPYKTESSPEIIAVPDASSEAVVTLPETLPGTAVIEVSDKNDKSMYTYYSVYMRAIKEIEIEASGAQHGNPPEQCMDKMLETRWAVEGESFGIFRFAEPKDISSVWLATWKAQQRKLIFDIEVSVDGESFTEVWSGKSTSDKDELEEFKIPAGTYKAVKLVFHGTTEGAWNSILEVEFK